MSSIENPLPVNASHDQSSGPPALITQAMIDSLRRTKPWVRFLSILGFIATGFLILVGLALAVGIGLLSSIGRTSLGGLPAILIGCFYVLLGLVYIFPALYLFRFADGIQKALSTDLVPGIEYALRNQKSFWTFAGVFMLIALVVQILLLAALIIVGIAGLAGLRGLQAAL
jgi:hypothetical protein